MQTYFLTLCYYISLSFLVCVLIIELIYLTSHSALVEFVTVIYDVVYF